MTAKDNDFRQIDVPLSPRETFSIGRIIALWGMLEHIVFLQTLESFDAPNGEAVALPKEMNNIQFTGVLRLWKTRVVDTAKGNRAKVLRRQHARIVELHPQRNALVHGMWDWSAADPEIISVIRVRKEQVITSNFNAAALEDLSHQVGGIIYKIKYPGGLKDQANDLISNGFGFSRIGASLMTGNPIAYELLGDLPPKDSSDPL